MPKISVKVSLIQTRDGVPRNRCQLAAKIAHTSRALTGAVEPEIFGIPN